MNAGAAGAQGPLGKVCWALAPRGYELPRHSHSHDETIIVLRGKLVLDFGGAQFIASFAAPFDMKAEPPAPSRSSPPPSPRSRPIGPKTQRGLPN